MLVIIINGFGLEGKTTVLSFKRKFHESPFGILKTFSLLLEGYTAFVVLIIDNCAKQVKEEI